MTDTTGFPLLDYGCKLRDLGMGQAEDAQDRIDREWKERARVALRELAHMLPTVHIDDFLTFFPERPARPNAAASVWVWARRQGLIVPSGMTRPCKTDPCKRFHQYVVYKSTVYRVAFNGSAGQ